MSVLLPTRPGIRSARPRMLDWTGRLVPVLGGVTQHITRLGTRWALEFTLPPLRSQPTGRTWVAALAQAKLEGARMRFPQDGFSTGSPGTPVVDGAGQAGSTLAIAEAQPRYVFRAGQFVSLVHDGRRYLHMVTATVAVAGDGTAELALLPMLRVIPDDGDAIEVAVVTIEGALAGDELPWDVLNDPYLDLGTIRIDEDE